MTQAVQVAQYGQSNVGLAFKNRIINGAMVIDQRNAGASITGNNNTFAVDRFRNATSQSSKFTAQQNAGSVTPPAGYKYYLGITSSSAYSVLSSDYFLVGQPIEGVNVADLAWGSANAKTVTLSFWVYSSLTGTFGGSINNNAYDRCYPFSYTVSSANTWTQISVTIAGDTTGTWTYGTGAGIYVWFNLGSGSANSGTANTWAGAAYYAPTGATSVVGTNGATFYITGVQLEVGSSATSFDYRPYGTELALCQRYYSVPVPTGGNTGTGFVNTGTVYYTSIKYPVTMRANPTIAVTGTIGNVTAFWSGSAIAATGYGTNSITTDIATTTFTVSSGLTINAAIQANMGTGNSITASAEL